MTHLQKSDIHVSIIFSKSDWLLSEKNVNILMSKRKDIKWLSKSSAKS